MKFCKPCIIIALNACALNSIQAFAPIQTTIPSRSMLVLGSTNDFNNQGPFSFMQPTLSLIGFQEGKTTYYGPAIDVDPSDYPSDEEQQKRRQLAQEQMYNIGEEERQRRKEAGELFQKISIAYAIVTSLTDDGGVGGMVARFAVAFPLFLAVGYTKSAESGLWNIAQDGLWDVDGTGIRKIEDENLAQAFLSKVNEMNVNTGRDVLIVATIFAALDHVFVFKLALSSILVLGLYLLKGKIPTVE